MGDEALNTENFKSIPRINEEKLRMCLQQVIFNAKVVKASYDALRDEGFDKKQAIVLCQGLFIG